MECPSCKGKGNSTGYGCPGFKLVTINCDICKGTGHLPLNIQYDPARGKQLKDSRMEPYQSMRDSAKQMSITLSELSRQERGYFIV